MKYEVTEVWFHRPLPVKVDAVNNPSHLSEYQNKNGVVWDGEFDSDTGLVFLNLRVKNAWVKYAIGVAGTQLTRLGDLKGKKLKGPLIEK